MLTNILACVICTYAPFDSSDSIESIESFKSELECYHVIDDFEISMFHQNMALNQKERDAIWMQWHLAIKRRDRYLYDADQAAFKMTDLEMRKIVNSAIQGAILAIASKSPPVIATGACLNVLSEISGEMYWSFMKARDCVEEAHFYAQEAERLQEELWRG